MVGVAVGQVHQKVDDGVHLAFAQQVKAVLFDLGQQTVVVATAPQLIHRFAVAAVLQQPVCCAQVQLSQAFRRPLLQALLAGVAQGRVVAQR